MTATPDLASGLLGDSERDQYLTDFGKATLNDRYLFTGETYQDLFIRVAKAYADDAAHAQRLYDYMSQGWFMPATPILSNGGTTRGFPISCFLNAVSDDLESIIGVWNENAWLAARGGGIGTYWGVREKGDKISNAGKTSGVIPFIKVQDSMTLAISQGSLRRGSSAAYLDIHHPEIEEFLIFRRTTGGDLNRRGKNIHQGVILTDEFMDAVFNGKPFNLIGPRTGEVVKTVQARDLMNLILEMRMETGEPYLLFQGNAKRSASEVYKRLGLFARQSNLCSEIMLHTGEDYTGRERTAVCCLSSVNAETFLAWRDHPTFIEDIYRFLDNVIQDFIDRTNGLKGFERARYSAYMERSVGLGLMGFHSFLQSQNVAFESAVAKSWNKMLFKHLRAQADAASYKLAVEKGACPDAIAAKLMERFANKLAVAPTASISIICHGVSAGIDPALANSYTHKTLSGSFAVKNPHLKKLLASYGRDDADTWSSITSNEGSVQHLKFLTDHERDVYKTAIEIDQRWVVDHAIDRTESLDQGQSVNLFLAGDVSKAQLVALVARAYRGGVKSLYYQRSLALSRAERISDVHVQPQQKQPELDDCLACQ